MFFANRKYPLRRQDREGYVLIMTLVLIVVAALTQAGLARRSLQLATEAVEAQNELQRRWGTISCRRFLLDNAAERFLRLEEQHLKLKQPWPTPSISAGRIILGRLQFSLQLSDEDAKLNLNTLEKRLPARCHQLANQLSGDVVPLVLRPDLRNEAVQSKNWYTSWGQVLPLPEILSLGAWEPLLKATSQITCWGTGKLNIKRANDVLLEAIVSQEIDVEAAREFLDARKGAAEIELDSLLNQLDLRRSQLAKLRAWLSDESDCFSLGIEIADRQRKWYHYYIAGDRGASADRPFLAFHW